jgi:hypothetical protein
MGSRDTIRFGPRCAGLDVFGFGPPHLRHKARAGKRPSGDQRVAVPHQGETVVSLWLVTKPRAWPRSRIVRHGNMRLQQALYLLKTDKIPEATPHLNAVAEDKTALETTQAAKDRKVAAVAYRNLGAIAGLADPKRALEAYEKAVALDPDDLESLVWIGEIQIDHGDLNEAQTRLERVLTLAKTDDQVGDVQVAQGDLAGALKSYRDGFALTWTRWRIPTPATRAASMKSGPATQGSATFKGFRATSPARRNPIGTASPFSTCWRKPTPATRTGSAICWCRSKRSAMCRWRRATLPSSEALTAQGDHPLRDGGRARPIQMPSAAPCAIDPTAAPIDCRAPGPAAGFFSSSNLVKAPIWASFWPSCSAKGL